MSRELIYMCVQPIDKYFVWQVALWLQSLQNIGEDDKAHVLLYKPKDREMPDQWNKLAALYPKARFELYEDESVVPMLGVYLPVLRPATLERHFTKYPELSEKVIFYCDSDILFTKKLDIDKFLDDNVCYLSDTISYIGANYLNRKRKECMPRMADMMEKKDVLADMCRIVGIDKQTAEDNIESSGGAQYLLKNVDAAFWEKVKRDCVSIYMYLQNINNTYFENEAKGYQAWCADMWAVLYNLWYLNKETKVVPEVDFAWATDDIKMLDIKPILHNAGITSDSIIRTRWKDSRGEHIHVNAPAFYKGKFKDGNSPYENMTYLNAVLNDDVSKGFCTYYYTKFLVDNKDKLWEIVKS